MRSLLRLLTTNWKLKLAAFTLAVLLWIAVSAEQITTAWLPVAIDVEVRDPEYELLAQPDPREVEVRFTGLRRELSDLAFGQPRLVLPIEEVEEEAEAFALDPQMVRVPRTVDAQPQDVRPASVRLTFGRVESKEVPVSVQISRAPGDGRTLADTLRVTPGRVRIRGPARLVDRIEAVPTQPLDLSREDSTFVRSLALDTARLGRIRLSATEVEVAGHVAPVVTRTLDGVPVADPSGTAVTPQTVTVELRGARPLVGDIEPGDLRVEIPVASLPAEIPEEGLTLPVRVQALPAGVQAQVDPATVRVIPRPPSPEVVAGPDSGALPDTTPTSPPPP